MRKLFVWTSLLTVLAILALPAVAGTRAPGGALSLATGARLVSAPARGTAVEFEASFWNVRRQDTVRLQVLCLQDGGVVYGDNHVLSGSPSYEAFVLGEPSNGTSVWSGGAASCRGDLYVVGPGGRVTYLARIGFEALG